MRFKTTSVAQRRAAAKLRHNKWQTFFAVFPTRYTNVIGQATGEWCWLERYLRTSRDGDGFPPWVRMPATALLTTKRDAAGRLRDAAHKADTVEQAAGTMAAGMATMLSKALALNHPIDEIEALNKMLQKNKAEMDAAIQAAQDGN